MRLPLDLSNGGWHMPKSLNFRHVNRYSEDRTSAVKRRLASMADRVIAERFTLSQRREANPPEVVLWISYLVWTQVKAIRCMGLQTRYNLRACTLWRASNSNARKKL